MIDVIPAYAAFVLLSGGFFAFFSPHRAILATFLGGWMLLPVGVFPEQPYQTTFPYWIIGVGLPSDMLVTKAWVTACAALFWALLFDRAAALRYRPGWIDLPMALWCAAPILLAPLWAAPDPHPATSSAYLFASWGALWLLGRIWFATTAAQVDFAKALALMAVAAIPIAWFEGRSLMSFHAMLYVEHPNRLEGVQRPVGYRSVGFFEHGNQYSLWVSLCALAAVWVALSRPRQPLWLLWLLVALVALVVGTVHQSRGAILLLIIGLALTSLWRFRLGPVLLVLIVVFSGAGLGLHYSGSMLDWLMAAVLFPRTYWSVEARAADWSGRFSVIRVWGPLAIESGRTYRRAT